MFNNNPSQNEKIDSQFIICYSKLTKPIAVSLRNSIPKDKKSVIWSKEVYYQNEARLTSANKLLLLHEDLISENLANPNIVPHTYLDGVFIKQENATIGFYVDPKTELTSFKSQFKESWKKYVSGMVLPVVLVGGIPVASLVTFLFFLSDKKKVKFRLLFDAINKFVKDGGIEKFLKGEKIL